MARILLIDDDEAVRGILGQILRRAGHTVIEARDGDEGVDLFPQAAADLVITDMMMPGKTGQEVVQALRRDRPQVKIIAMSGGGRLGLAEVLGSALLEGATEVLAKPFTFGVLFAAIDRVLGKDRAGTEASATAAPG
jgi:CheY-like chemotaxis protein